MKKLFALLIAMCLIPAAAGAKVFIGGEEITGTYTISTNDAVITGDGAATNVNIIVEENVTTVTLGGGVHIAATNGAPLLVKNNTTVTLTGDNVLDASAADGFAGLAQENVLVKESKGVYTPSGGLVTITGTGSLTARGGSNAAGIGGGNGEGGYVSIMGGTIRAVGGSNGAGIGSGYGALTARDGVYYGDAYVTISGGNVTAEGGESAAGIGGGYDRPGDASFVSCVMISGGTVKATGGAGSIGGPGVGGAYYHKCYVEISGGEVTAQGRNIAAGIGGGKEFHGVHIVISGGTIKAIGGDEGAGIGAGFGYNANYDIQVDISGGEIDASGGKDGPALCGGLDAGISKIAATVYADEENAIAIQSSKDGASYAHADGGMFVSEREMSKELRHTRYLKISPYQGPVVVFDPGEGTGAMDFVKVSGTYKLPQCTFTAPTDEEFICWKIGSKTYKAGASITVSKNIAATAQWEKMPRITFNKGEYGSGKMNYQLVNSGTQYELPASEFESAADDKVFAGWQVLGDTSKTYAPGDKVTISSDTQFVAQWADLVYVSFDANGGSGTMEPVKVAKGSKYTVPECEFTAPDEKTKQFNWWAVGTKHYSAGSKITVSGDTTLKANWITKYEVIFNANGGSGTMEKVYCKRYSSYTLPECGFTPPKGMQFAHWKLNDKTYDPGMSISVSKWMNQVYAVWQEKDKVAVSFDANGGEGQMDSVELYSEEDYALPACSFMREGYAFAGWMIDEAIYEPGDVVKARNMTIAAAWKVLEVTLDTVETALEDSKDFTPELIAALKLDVDSADTAQIVEGITGLMELNLTALGADGELTAHYDVQLMISYDGENWTPATPENFPEGGLEVVLPYPEGTDPTNYEFFVTHMFTTGEKAGEIEAPDVIAAEDGLHFVVTGLSPVSVGWRVKANGVEELPSTGDASSLVLWMALLGLTGAALFMLRKRAHN